MDLFRRLFGKTNEQAVPAEEVKQPPEAVEEDDDLDPTTLPVGTQDLMPRTPSVAEGVTQPLSPETVMTYRNDSIAFGQVSDVGLVRSNNQDSALSFLFTSRSVDDQPDFGLFIVADGMGGHHDGERASAITTKSLAAHITHSIYLPLLNGTNDIDQVPLTEAMVNGVKKSNEEVIKHVPEGGTTVTAVVLLGDLAHIAHVGDSRAYLLTKDGIEQITRDHSLVQRLIELDQITPEEAADHPQKNVLYRALGQNETIEVDTITRRLPPESRVLICSDGLWGQVEERDLYEICMNVPDPQQACEKLAALANTHGGVDNITSILLKIS